MLLSKVIRFLEYDHPTFYWVLSQFHLTWRDGHPALGPKHLVPQPWESVAAVGNTVVNAVLCGIYNDKKIAVERFSMSVVIIFTTYIIVDYF